jgi:hypothetical protein
MFTKALDVKQFTYLWHFLGLKWPIPCEEEWSRWGGVLRITPWWATINLLWRTQADSFVPLSLYPIGLI